MIPLKFESSNHEIIINTGNVLTVYKKAGQKPTEELFDCIQATLKEPIFEFDKGEIHRMYDDLKQKINEHERNNIKIGAKLFLNTNSVEYLKEAVNNLLRVLDISFLDNLILAYHPPQQQNSDDIEENQVNEDSENKEKSALELPWNKKTVDDLILLWKVLETFAENKTICQLGIADLDTETLRTLYESCKIPPTITQINLSSCCVVPPSLQEFCNGHDIQLLTHSDPEVILTDSALNQLGINKYKPKWTIRYQVHVKCRGLLTAKGFIIGVNQENNS